MKHETVKKINNLGEAGYVICKISKIILFIAAASCLLGGILMCFIPKEAAKIELMTENSAVIRLDPNLKFAERFSHDGESFLEIGSNTYQLVMNESDEPVATMTVIYLSDFKWILFSAVIACIAVYVVFHVAGKLCAYFKNCETPFTEAISKQVTNLAWSLIPLCLVSSLTQSLTDSVLSGNFKFLLSVDLMTVFLILCVFMLSFVFKYGTDLQAESDETL